MNAITDPLPADAATPADLQYAIDVLLNATSGVSATAEAQSLRRGASLLALFAAVERKAFG